ncbi:unnamed protein product [Debaryomyces fabryi]|nr:unnamed protein product [Debaryomyces fabryi]
MNATRFPKLSASYDLISTPNGNAKSTQNIFTRYPFHEYYARSANQESTKLAPLEGLWSIKKAKG